MRRHDALLRGTRSVFLSFLILITFPLTAADSPLLRSCGWITRIFGLSLGRPSRVPRTATPVSAQFNAAIDGALVVAEGETESLGIVLNEPVTWVVGPGVDSVNTLLSNVIEVGLSRGTEGPRPTEIQKVRDRVRADILAKAISFLAQLGKTKTEITLHNASTGFNIILQRLSNGHVMISLARPQGRAAFNESWVETLGRAAGSAPHPGRRVLSLPLSAEAPIHGRGIAVIRRTLHLLNERVGGAESAPDPSAHFQQLVLADIVRHFLEKAEQESGVRNSVFLADLRSQIGGDNRSIRFWRRPLYSMLRMPEPLRIESLADLRTAIQNLPGRSSVKAALLRFFDEHFESDHNETRTIQYRLNINVGDQVVNFHIPVNYRVRIVAGGTLVFVGTDIESSRAIGSGTEVVDYPLVSVGRPLDSMHIPLEVEERDALADTVGVAFTDAVEEVGRERVELPVVAESTVTPPPTPVRSPPVAVVAPSLPPPGPRRLLSPVLEGARFEGSDELLRLATLQDPRSWQPMHDALEKIAEGESSRPFEFSFGELTPTEIVRAATRVLTWLQWHALDLQRASGPFAWDRRHPLRRPPAVRIGGEIHHATLEFTSVPETAPSFAALRERLLTEVSEALRAFNRDSGWQARDRIREWLFIIDSLAHSNPMRSASLTIAVRVAAVMDPGRAATDAQLRAIERANEAVVDEVRRVGLRRDTIPALERAARINRSTLQGLETAGFTRTEIDRLIDNGVVYDIRNPQVRDLLESRGIVEPIRGLEWDDDEDLIELRPHRPLSLSRTDGFYDYSNPPFAEPRPHARMRTR